MEDAELIEVKFCREKMLPYKKEGADPAVWGKLLEISADMKEDDLVEAVFAGSEVEYLVQNLTVLEARQMMSFPPPMRKSALKRKKPFSAKTLEQVDKDAKAERIQYKKQVDESSYVWLAYRRHKKEKTHVIVKLRTADIPETSLVQVSNLWPNAMVVAQSLADGWATGKCKEKAELIQARDSQEPIQFKSVRAQIAEEKQKKLQQQKDAKAAVETEKRKAKLAQVEGKKVRFKLKPKKKQTAKADKSLQGRQKALIKSAQKESAMAGPGSSQVRIYGGMSTSDTD